jgi:hypothetical protein
MTDHAIVAGIEIPSNDPIFLAIVAVHVLLGLIFTVTGLVAMLSVKRAGRHPTFGSIYFWSLTGVFVTAAVSDFRLVSIQRLRRGNADVSPRAFYVGTYSLTHKSPLPMIR